MTRAGFHFALAALVSAIMPFAAARADPPTAASVGSTQASCGDLLARTGRKPPHVVFGGCTIDTDRQGKPMRAVYTVRGVYAAQAEAWLARHANLPRLKRSCCQWDGPAGQYTAKDGKSYSVTMVSPETPWKSRRSWRRIKVFEITAETLTEDI